MTFEIYWPNIIIMGEVLFAEHLFAHFLVQREHYIKKLIGSVTLCMFIAFLLPAPSSFPVACLIYPFILILSGFTLWFCYEEDFWAILFLCITGYTIHHLAYCLNDGTRSLLSFYNIELPYALVYFCTAIPPFCICYLLFSKAIKKYRKIHVDNKKMLLLSAGAIFVDVFIGLILIPSDAYFRYIFVTDLVSIVCCILILSLQFSLLTNKQLETELQIMDQIIKEQKKHYELSKDNIQLINLKCHDLKYQLRKIRNTQDEIDRDALKDVENAIGIYDSVVRTCNVALDTLLTEKSLICESEKIKLTCMIDSKGLEFISPADIYSLFGNALDNAIEAVCKLKDPDNRNISLNICKTGNFIAIHIENTFDGDLALVDGLPVTTKDDTDYHGFGMKSMALIVEKYKGHMAIDADKEFFHLHIIFPCPSQSSVQSSDTLSNTHPSVPDPGAAPSRPR